MNHTNMYMNIKHSIRHSHRTTWGMRAAILLIICQLSCFTVKAQTDSVRVFTTERPLVYEDAWDLWPYVFLNENGEPDGYNIDLLKLIFKELDIPYIIKLKPTLEAQADLKSGKSDLMLRMDADFSRGNSSYGRSIVQLFTHSAVMPKDKMVELEAGKDLSRYAIIVHEGSFSHHLINNNGWAKEIIAYDDMKEAIQKVSSSNDGIIIWNTMSLKWLMRKFHTDNLTIQAIDLPYGEYKFMSKNHTLLNQIDSVYSQLRANDRLQPIQNKWFYPDRKDTGIPSWVWQAATTMAIIAIAILLYYIVYRFRERKMTKVMRKSNDRLSLILKTSHVTIWTYNILTKTFTWMDEQGRAQHSSSLEEFVYRYRPEDVFRLQQIIDDITQQRIKNANINIRLFEESVGKKEHNYTLSLSVLRRNRNGSPMTILCTRSDITNELLRQMKIKDTMLRYQAIFQTAMIDMIYYNEYGYIVDMNQKALKSLGITIEQLRAKQIHIDDVLGIEKVDYEHMDNLYVTQLYTSPDDPRILNRMLKRKKLYYELQIVPIHDVNGKLLGLFGSGRDVTETADSYQTLENNVQELQQANNEISKYIRNIDYVLTVGGLRIVKYDLETHMLTIFSEANHIQFTLTQSRILNFVDEHFKKKVERIINSMDNQTPNAIHAEIKTTLHGKDKQALHLQFHFIPYQDSNGKVKDYFGMCRDISELKHIEEKLAQETLRAQEVEVVKNAFLHNMSFEIRTPLNTVVGFAELFQMDHSAEDEIVFIKEIKENSAKLLKLINDILFLSRLDADMITMSTRTIDIAKGVEAKCEMIWGKDKKPGVDYIVKNPFRKLVLDIDDSNVTIILDKIITNAVEHTTKGSVMVRYDYIGDQLVVAIDDTGDGIPKNTLKHIFERFVTGDSNNSKAGLGLSICHDLIQHLGGTINIKSTVGKGTSVWFSIPCKALESDRI